MRIIPVALLTVALLELCAASQPDDVKKFAGTWQAEFKGTPYLVVTLKGLSGTISIGSITMNGEGDLADVQEAVNEHPIQAVRVNGDTVYFQAKDEEYEVTLTGEGQAVLRIIDAPPLIGPFGMRRARNLTTLPGRARRKV
jgi:hypothetical protein